MLGMASVTSPGIPAHAVPGPCRASGPASSPALSTRAGRSGPAASRTKNRRAAAARPRDAGTRGPAGDDRGQTLRALDSTSPGPCPRRSSSHGQWPGPHPGRSLVARSTPPSSREETEEEEKLEQERTRLSSLGLDSRGQACDPLCSVDDMTAQEYEDVTRQGKSDLVKAVVIGLGISLAAALINLDWVEHNQNLTMSIVFSLGYLGIIFEESLAFNKAGVALLMAVALWVVRSIGAPTPDIAYSELTHQSAEVAEIVFFLLGAMTIVEIVDAHQGFRLVTDSIQTRSPRKLLWLVGGITFFLSSVLDNLTSTIVMVSLLRKLVPDPERRRFLGAVVVIAANAGGAWTPIGDVTTTMLWIHGQISTVRTIQDLFVPSAVSLLLPLAVLSFDQGLVSAPAASVPASTLASEQMAPRGRLVFGVGVGSLLFVPVFKSLTGLPPFLGMLLGLGALWLLTDAIHFGESDRQRLRVPQALSRIDTQGVLFFLGILLAVGSLDSAGILRDLALFLDQSLGSTELIAGAIGLASAVVDNVPLVAATMGMYDLEQVPMDSQLWQLIAYCAGTGGSILIIGSAAGVAFMGMEKADFFWYLRKVSGVAFIGYAAGLATYLAGQYLPAIGDATAQAAQLLQ